MSINAKEWLLAYLNVHTAANVRDIRESAEGAGIKRKDLKAAKSALGVVTTNDWMAGVGAEHWYWSLPGKETP